jgi:DNA-binding transcriptional LysR family regulator
MAKIPNEEWPDGHPRATSDEPIGVSLRQLRALIAVGQTASFTVAAEQLGLSQPSVSHLVRRLENELGQPLVVRGRDVRLTSQGAHIADVARRALLSIDTALQESKSQTALTSGSVSVAVGHMSAAVLLPQILNRFKRTHPKIELIVTDCMAHEIKGKILSNEVDVGLGAIVSVRDSQITTEKMFDSRVALFVRKDSSLARSSELDASILAEVPCIQLNPNAPLWLEFSRQLLARNIYPRIEQRVTLLSTVIGMIQAGMGVAMLPRIVGSQMPGTIQAVAIGNPELRWPLSIVRRTKYPSSPAAKAFIEVVREEARNFRDE